MIFCYGAVFLWLCRPCLESYLFYDYDSYKPVINCVWWVPETIFYVWRQSSRYFEENLLLTVSSNCMLSSLGMLRVLPEYLSLHHQLTEAKKYKFRSPASLRSCRPCTPFSSEDKNSKFWTSNIGKAPWKIHFELFKAIITKKHKHKRLKKVSDEKF